MSVENHGSVFDPNIQKQLAKETANNVSSGFQILKAHLTLYALAKLRRREGIVQESENKNSLMQEMGYIGNTF